MTSAELTAALDAHDKWLARVAGGVRLDLTGDVLLRADFRGCGLSWAVFRGSNLVTCQLDWCDLRCCDFRGADLSTATFCRSILAGSAFAGARVNRTSPELVGELIAREAATPARRRLASWIGDALRGPWPGPIDDPDWPWAQSVLARYR